MTLRAVAQRVGGTAMALYGHLPDKDSLLDAMAGRVIGEAFPGPISHWPGGGTGCWPRPSWRAL